MHNDQHPRCRAVLLSLLLLLSTSMAYAAPKSSLMKSRSFLQRAVTQGTGIVLGTLIACAGLTGCERGELRPFADVLQERGEAEIIPTQDIFVIVDDKDYYGVIGKDGNGRIVVQTFLDSGAFVFTQDMEGSAGFALDHHQYVGKRVYLDGVRGTMVVQRSGIVEELFDNGYYLIAIDRERYVADGSPVALFVPYDIIAHEFYLEKKDGSSFAGNARRQEPEED